MHESQLTELLERAGDRTAVGPPPLDAMRAGAARRKRRRTTAISLAATVSVAVAAGGTALLMAPEDGTQQLPTATKGTSHATNPMPTATNNPPTGGRLVGLGHVAIAVPQGWGTNQVRCGTPQTDTVLIDGWLTQACAVPRPVGVESVEVGDGGQELVYKYGFKSDDEFEIDGVRAQKQRTICAPGGAGGPQVCRGIVLLPSTGVWFSAESSTNAAEVDRILERIVVLPDRVGVPEQNGVTTKDDGSSGRKYADLLRGLGLRVETKTTDAPGFAPGELVKVEPFPGTMLPLGATVTVTVVAKR
ncbi:PASTA domain-containing protein [Kribbella sp. NPDC051718]|uniref:PASTA domain-containing protein n=1 Tax=Kribbella sp. NPDC051718 TaxID=3155168 RepID=UPI00344A045F